MGKTRTTCFNVINSKSVYDVEKGEANEDDSDSHFETNMVRYYQWNRGDNGYLIKLMVETDADEALRLWQSTVEMLTEAYICGGSLKRFTALQIV